MLHPPVKEKIFDTIIFRNDDVSYDTNVENFIKFNEVFHRYGFVQLHGINLWGRTNYSILVGEQPWIYEDITPEEIHEYEKCKEVSTDYIGDNYKLIKYINSIPDPIALHGLYHSDYSQMTYEQQEHDIVEGLKCLKKLFPHKQVDTFIAPFNLVNEYTYLVCAKYGLRVSALEGEHLEDRIANDKGPLYEGEIYRYHHHRFYPESTCNFYNLSMDILEEYLKKYAYTLVDKTERSMPSLAMIKACVSNGGIDVGYITEQQNVVNEVVRCVYEYLSVEDKVLQVNCGIGDLLHRLWAFGYSNLFGIDGRQKYVNSAKKMVEMIDSGVNIQQLELKQIIEFKGTNAVICIWNSCDNDAPSAFELFHYCSKILNDLGYIILANPYETEEELIDLAGKFNAMLINTKPYSQEYGNRVYVFKRIRPQICLLCDRPNWAHDNSAKELQKYLSDEFEVDIKYVIDHEELDINQYDAFQIFFWGETSYKKYEYSKSRIIKQVSSHRWQFDKPYGPISAEEFREIYLDDASTIICPSQILYDILKPIVKNLFLCGKGYAPELFRYTGPRTGEMSMCMVGNLKDPVKGVEDILKPATESYQLDMAQTIKHEDLLKFYNGHDVYVVSSVHEADPLPLIESMACGCFPIASKIGIAPELIRHKQNGYLVEERTVDEFRKAINWCNENIEYIRGQAGKIADEIYEKRRWEVMAENYREMFREHIRRR